MTVVKLLSDKKGNLIGFDISGHSSKSYDDEFGKIVCAAVSSAAYMAVNTVTDIVGSEADIVIDDGKMYFSVINPDKYVRVVLDGFKIHIKQLSEQYRGNIKVYTEV